jgi:hypothetical protein
MDVDHVAVAEPVITPDPAQQLLSAEHESRCRRQDVEQVELGPRQVELASRQPDLATGRVDLEVAKHA